MKLKTTKPLSTLMVLALMAPTLASAAGTARETKGSERVRVGESAEKEKAGLGKQQEQMRAVDQISRLLIDSNVDVTGVTQNSLRALLSSQRKVIISENGANRAFDVSEIITSLARQAEAVNKSGTAAQKKDLAIVASFVGLLARTSKSAQNASFLSATEKEAVLATDILNQYKGAHREEHLREMAKTVEIALKNPTMPAEKAYEEGLVQVAKDLAREKGLTLEDSKAREMASKEAERKRNCLTKI